MEREKTEKTQDRWRVALTHMRGKIMKSRDDENESEAAAGVKNLSEPHMCS